MNQILSKRFTYVIWLPELSGAMGELAELVKWAVAVVSEVLAQLCLILLLQGINLALAAIEAVVV